MWFSSTWYFDNICTGSLSNKVRASNELYLNSVKFEKFKGEVLREIEERNKQKIKQVWLTAATILFHLALEKKKEMREKIKEEWKETIKQLEAKIQEEQQLNKKLEDKKVKITKSNITYSNCNHLKILYLLFLDLWFQKLDSNIKEICFINIFRIL